MLFFSFFSLLSCHFSQLLYTHYSLAYSSRVPQYYNNFKDFPYGLPKTTQHLTFTYQQPSKTNPKKKHGLYIPCSFQQNKNFKISQLPKLLVACVGHSISSYYLLLYKFYACILVTLVLFLLHFYFRL